MIHTKYQGSKHCGFRQEDFIIFSLKCVTTGAGLSLWGFCVCSFLVVQWSWWERERADCFTLIVFLVYCDSDCSVDLPHNAIGWSAVFDCSISWSYSLILEQCVSLYSFTPKPLCLVLGQITYISYLEQYFPDRVRISNFQSVQYNIYICISYIRMDIENQLSR